MNRKPFGTLNWKVGTGQAYIMLASTVFLWAVGIVIARGVHDEIPLIGLSFWRWLIAALIMLPFVWHELREKSDIVKENIKLLITQGVLLIGSGTLIFYALNFTTAINAALVNAIQPVTTSFLAWIMIRERLRSFQIAGIVSAVLGVSIMVSKANWNVIVTFGFNSGDILTILATIGYSAYAVNIQNLPKKLGIYPALFVILLAGSFFLLPFYIVETIQLKPVPFEWATAGIIIVLAVLVSILPMGMWNTANSVVGPGRSAIFVNLIPVYGSILAIPLLGEKLFLYHVFGAVFVCIGIFMVIQKR